MKNRRIEELSREEVKSEEEIKQAREKLKNVEYDGERSELLNLIMYYRIKADTAKRERMKLENPEG